MVSLLLGSLVLGGCATKGDIRDIQEEMTRMSQRQEEALDELQRSSETSREQLEEGQETRLMDFQGEVRTALREIATRLTDLEQVVRQMGRDQALMRDEIANLPRGPARAGPIAGIPSDSTGAEVMPYDPTEADALFQEAEESLVAGDLTAARFGFEAFIQQYIGHPRTPDAYYLLGDVLFQEGSFEDAIEAFLTVPQIDENSSRVPGSLYRAGIISIEVGRPDDARRYLRRFVQNYPNDPLVELAQQTLDEIGG